MEACEVKKLKLNALSKAGSGIMSKPPVDPTDYRDPDPFTVEAQGHRFAFYPNGADRMKALVKHIEGATSSLAVYYYMFQDDQSGTVIRDCLVAAAKRGVDVHLIIDDFGSDAPHAFFDPLVDAGGRFSVFQADWNVRYLVRNHQKMVIADGKRVFTGGFNISDHYFMPPSDNGWCDLGVQIDGPVAEKFTAWFDLIKGWVESDGSQFRRIRTMVRDWEEGDGPVRLLVGAPLVRRSHWAWRLKRDLAGARRADMVTAYFSPTRSIRFLLRKIARRKGEGSGVRLIVAGKSDFEAAIATARLLYRRLLRSGVKIFEFQPCKLHMKLIVIDDIAYFGSANLDKRSIRINVELMVRVEDAELAAALRELMDHMEAASKAVTPEWYEQKATFLTRMSWRLTYLVALADYRVARSLNI